MCAAWHLRFAPGADGDVEEKVATAGNTSHTRSMQRQKLRSPSKWRQEHGQPNKPMEIEHMTEEK